MNSGNIVKQGDIFKLQYKLFGVDNNPVNVSGMQIAVKIANKRAVVYETTAIAVAEGIVEFEVNENIGHGEMYIELKVSNGTVAVQRYPAEDWLKIRVTPSLDNIELYGLTTVSVEQLQNELRQIQFDYQEIVDDKIEDMEYTVQISSLDSYEALLTAESANTKSTNAVNIAETVRNEFDQVVVEVEVATLNAETSAIHANTQGDFALEVAESNVNVRLSPVANFAAIATTYPTPVFGSKVQTTDNGKIYRFDGTDWNFVEEMNSNMLTDIQTELVLSKIVKSATAPSEGVFWLDTSVE